MPNDLLQLFQYNSEIHDHNTRNAVHDGFHIPSINTTTFGNKSLRYSAPVLWNNLLNDDKEINGINSNRQFKKYMNTYFLSKYK